MAPKPPIPRLDPSDVKLLVRNVSNGRTDDRRQLTVDQANHLFWDMRFAVDNPEWLERLRFAIPAKLLSRRRHPAGSNDGTYQP